MREMGHRFDPLYFVEQAKSAGVPLYASTVWCDLLNVKANLPPDIGLLEVPELCKLLAESEKVIGGP
jgi:hypothetical protein